MKRASSRSIERFIRHIDRGLITGKELSTGPFVLKNMRDALQAILDGEKPDKALGLSRKTGPAPEPHSLPLAIMVNQWRTFGTPASGGKPENWSVIETLANDLLRDNGYPPMTLSAIKRTYKEHLPRVYQYLHVLIFNDVIDRINEQNKKDR
jgi:hypothetical protein